MQESPKVDFLPPEAARQLEFDKILDRMATYCVSRMGVSQIQALHPSSDIESVVAELRIIGDIMKSMTEQERLKISEFEEMDVLLNRLKIENSVLNEEEFFLIKNQLVNLEHFVDFFSTERMLRYPDWAADWSSIMHQQEPYRLIDKVINEKGEVRENASPELTRIAKAIQNEQKALDRQFAKLLQQFKGQGYLSENAESVRNGRRVLTLKSEHKRKIKGIIHDESATGKTTFMEPAEIVQLNNQLFDLSMEYRKEIRRILTALSRQVAPWMEELLAWQKYLVQYDTQYAKAYLGNLLDATIPKYARLPQWHLVAAYHPLLLIKHDFQKDKVIPLDFHLGEKSRLLILSGPNAGGKSVALKTVGLMQLMFQCAMPVPVHPDSTMGWFEQLFVDIGDHQSIEDDLSTYSSHLTLMKKMLDRANGNTLILIDEFGSGTDPQIGGAIASEILLGLHRQKVVGLVATHYSLLKLLADKQKGMVNAAMQFDAESLKPTYHLRVGKPGSSFALEIAANCGLDPHLLGRAKNRMGKGIYQVDKLLSSLEDDKKKIQALIEESNSKQKQLDKLIKSYNQLSGELEYKRKKLQLRSKEMDLQTHQKYQKELDKAIKDIQQSKNEKQAKQLASAIRAEKEKLSEEVTVLDEIVYQDHSKKHAPHQVGDYVKHIKSGVMGQIERIERKKATVQVGALQMTIPVKELLPSKEPLPHKPQKSIQTQLGNNPFDFDTQLDIRGLKAEEAIKVVESFVDKAVIANAMSVKILHGKGNGVLRKVVHKKLSEYPSISDVYHPENEWGGEGISIVTFSR